MKEKLIQLLEAQVHFGHDINSFNKKMLPFIYTEINGSHIIDLVQTSKLLEQSVQFVYNLSLTKKTILFVGTKSEAKQIIQNQALRANSFYINYKWLNGILTNWKTIKLRIKRFKDLSQKKKEGHFKLLPNKEASSLKHELKKLTRLFLGVKDMENLPDAIILIYQHIEKTAIREAISLNIPIISIVDTNCDPYLIDKPIPGNDDSTLSINFIINKLSDGIISGHEDNLKNKTK